MGTLFESIRQLVLRGRATPGLYSCENWPGAPREPESAHWSQKAQHYGFNSEPPEGALVVTLGINGSSSHHTAVADFLADDPHGELEMGEAQLWQRVGQRLRLLNDGRIVISTPAERKTVDGGGNPTGTVSQTGGSIVLDNDTATVARNLAVTGDATVGHLIGASQGGGLTVPFPNVVLTGVAATGNDLSFEVSFTVPSSGPGLAFGAAIAVVQLGRAFASPPRCVVSASSDTWPTPPALSARSLSVQLIEIRWQGNSITGDDMERKLTVFVNG